MKIKTLAVAAGVSAPLILTGSVQAGFTGISTASKPNEFGLIVVNIYAEFDRPGQDHMLSVSGTSNAPLLIQVVGGVFYNHAFGSDNAPGPLLVLSFPSLAFDSFLTIGKKTSGGDHLSITPGFPGVSGSQISTDSSGWAVTPNHSQGNPFDAANSFPGNGQVLIGQFSTQDGTAIRGTMLLQYISNGVPAQSIESFCEGSGCSCQVNEDCSDFNPCNGEEICVDSVCETSPPDPDCNGNGVLDSCDVAGGTPDCNGNSIPDDCDIADGTSDDFNGDGIPDECQCISDINGDGEVGILDFRKVLEDWGMCK